VRSTPAGDGDPLTDKRAAHTSSGRPRPAWWRPGRRRLRAGERPQPPCASACDRCRDPSRRRWRARVSGFSVAVRIKRIYEPSAPEDGYRVLIDRMWPRGVSRERARLDEWARELAPSDDLRRSFDHVPERFAKFRAGYRDELRDHSAQIAHLRRLARKRRVTILYAARDREHNNAVVLAELLRDG
jgi:uncharacterized protein YeaO (DUF488 family)